MTPNEFYALPPLSVRPWYEDYNEVVQEVLKIDGWWGSDLHEKLKANDTGRFVIHEKLYHNVDGERGVGIYALYFDDEPFALMFTGGRGGRDSRDDFITNAENWQRAKDHANAMISRESGFDDEITNPDEELTNHYYSASVTRFGDEVRLVASDEVHRFTGNPVYDEKKYDEAFDRLVRPLSKTEDFKEGLSSPRILSAALEAYRTGIIGHRVDLNIELDHGDRMIAASVVEGQTFVHTISTRGIGFSWSGDIRTQMVGPEAMLEVYADLAEGRQTSANAQYIQDAANIFGADPETVLTVINSNITNKFASMAALIVETLPKDERVPEEMDHIDTELSLAYKTIDNPEIRRYCSNGHPSQYWAKQLIDEAAKLVEQKAQALPK